MHSIEPNSLKHWKIAHHELREKVFECVVSIELIVGMAKEIRTENDELTEIENFPQQTLAPKKNNDHAIGLDCKNFVYTFARRRQKQMERDG